MVLGISIFTSLGFFEKRYSYKGDTFWYILLQPCMGAREVLVDRSTCSMEPLVHACSMVPQSKLMAIQPFRHTTGIVSYGGFQVYIVFTSYFYAIDMNHSRNDNIIERVTIRVRNNSTYNLSMFPGLTINSSSHGRIYP